ncbi:hypothetical protein [Luteolibacter sp. LG18]|uniref:hypothetical protein n=1 Tax=Luteolibacter sp. LG18 TaxID=2819286 RepID=UPI002B29EC56|nr:hypothetical protein llg_04310 [Luteolibacter sp. LG18]
MSEEPLSSDSASEAPKKSRRVSTPRPRKTAKKAAAKGASEQAESAPEAPAVVEAPRSEPAPAPVEAPLVKVEHTPIPRDPRLDDISAHERPAAHSGWPEPETIQGGTEGSSSGKRKRRRKKKGGQGGQPPQQGGHPPIEGQQPRPQQAAPAEGQARPQAQQPQQGQQQPQHQQGPRIQVDPDDLAKKAWRIFLNEVGEEGLALIGDQDAREISRRSFKLAEIFLEEQGRRCR